MEEEVKQYKNEIKRLRGSNSQLEEERAICRSDYDKAINGLTTENNVLKMEIRDLSNIYIYLYIEGNTDKIDTVPLQSPSGTGIKSFMASLFLTEKELNEMSTKK